MGVKSRNIRTIGNMVYDNKELVLVLKDLLSSGYEWRVTKEVRERAGIPFQSPKGNKLWRKFATIGVIDGYFETKHQNSVYYIRIANGSIDKVKDILDYAVKE